MPSVALAPSDIAGIGPRIGRWPSLTLQRGAAVFFLLALLGLRIFAALHYRIDSDEPQHLHVVWGWANGLLQYRDVFDNHSPLFQMLSAPLFRALGVRPDIIVPMRLAMIPLFFLGVWCVYKIGVRLSNPLGGWIAAILTALQPTFFFVTAEYRTDDLWTALWLVAALILSGGEFRGRRAFCFGLLIGAAFGTSMKTSLLVASVGWAASVILVLEWLRRRPPQGREIMRALACALGGVVIVPALLIAFFAIKGALPQMYYCVVQHNAVPGLGKWRKIGFHQFIFPLSSVPMVALAWLILRSHPDRAIASRRAFFFLTAGGYLALLRSYWPLVTAQDYVPLLPISVLALTPALVWIGDRAARIHPLLRYALPCLLVAVEMFRLFRICPPTTNDVAPFGRRLADTLLLTDPDDPVMDAKGETIYRRRPFYYALEGVTIARMKRGLIADDLPQTLINTRTNVIYPHRLSEADYAFVNANYVEVSPAAKVAGKILGPAKLDGAMTFKTLWPARFRVISENDDAAGTLDGQPLGGAQTLPLGEHTLRLSSGSGRVALVWAQSLERGFSPFIKRPK